MPNFLSVLATRRWLALPLSAVPAVLLLALLGAAGPRPAEAGGVVNNCANDTQFAGFVSSGGQVSFACGGAPVTITLSSQQVISQNTTIDGGGLVTLSGAKATRLFSVTVGAQLTLLNVRLVQGYAIEGGAVHSVGSVHADHVTFYDNQVLASGASIYSGNGQVVVTATDFISNEAEWGGGIFAEGGSLHVQGGSFRANVGRSAAGAIDLNETLAVIAGATFDDNRSGTACCGALYSYGAVTVIDSVFQNNISKGGNGGGALGVEYSTLEPRSLIRSTQFISNGALDAGPGGAIRLFAGALDLENVTFEHNQTVDEGSDSNLSGGAIFSGISNAAARADLSRGDALPRADGGPAMARPAGFGGAGIEVVIRGARFYSNTANFSGGAIYSAVSTTLSVNNSTFIDNLADESTGGGISNRGLLTVTDSSFIGNTNVNSADGEGGGGAIFSDNTGHLQVMRSEFRQNHSDYEGGALDAGPARVQQTIFLSNTARFGGAIDVWSGDFHILDSAFIGNGVITTYQGSASEGGAIDTNGEDEIWITNTTFFGNYAAAPGRGGAINGDLGPLTVTHGTFYSNTAPAGNGGALMDNSLFVLRNSLVANNPGGNCQALLTFNGANLQFGDTSCGTASIQQDPLLAPGPAWLGGPTPVVALLTGSPAINAAAPANCTSADQRGFARPYGPACDLGAFEAVYRLWAPLLQR